VREKGTETAGFKCPPEMPAVEYTMTARHRPLPSAATGRPLCIELAEHAPPKNWNSSVPRNSAATHAGGTFPVYVNVQEIQSKRTSEAPNAYWIERSQSSRG